MNPIRTWTAAVVAVSAMVASACTTTYTAPGGSLAEYNRVTGNLTAVLEASLDRAWEAAVAAVEHDLKFEVRERTKDSLAGIVRARTADGKQISITLRRRGDNITEAVINAGILADDSLQRLVLEKIQARL